MSSERVILVDGSALVYRAFFALPPHLTTKDGIHTNAVFGFATMFKKLFAAKRPRFGAVVFDPPGKTTRDEKYPAYKAQRAPMPEELVEQLALIDRVVQANRFPMLRVMGLEADDVIGTLAQRAKDAGHEVVIVSSDKDFAQLIDDQLWMQDTIKDVSYDAELAKKKWGVPPSQIVDWLALMGDAADNIPGVDGIGHKGAVQLLTDHGSLDGIYAALDKDPSVFKGRTLKALIDGKASAYLSRELATIDRSAAVPQRLEALEVAEPDTAELNALYQSLEFYSLLSRDDVQQARAAAAVAADLVIAQTPDAVRDEVARIEGTCAVVPIYDGRYVHGALCGVALACNRERVVFVPLRLAGDDDARLRQLASFFEDPARSKVVHDAKELWVLLRRAGITLRGVAFDTRLASFLIEPNKLINQHHALEAVVKEFAHRTVPARKELTGGGKSAIALADVEPATRARYAAELVRAVYDLHAPLADRLKDVGQERQLFDVDLPLSWVLGQMELDGVAVDVGELHKIGDELRAQLAALEQRIHAHAGREFNVGSPKQLGEVLFDELKLPVIKKTKSGYSTDAEVLERLAPKHDICKEILEYRRVDKLINTYVDVLIREVHPATGRVHACFQQTVGVSGRLITMDPDLQRTPVKTADGVRIRKAFVARPLADGTPMAMIDADWSQIELRLLAHVSKDPVLVESFRTGADVHRHTAAEIFGKRADQVTKQEREVGKTVNFSTIYGQGALALSQMLGVSKKEADHYIARYFELYAGVRRWLDESIALADERGYATTLLGRRRVIPELRSRSPMDRGFGERVAANTPIQGGAADICKLAMLKISERLREHAPRARLLLQIHDELVIEAPVADAGEVASIVKDCMEHVMALEVPLVADVGIGASWGDAKA